MQFIKFMRFFLYPPIQFIIIIAFLYFFQKISVARINASISNAFKDYGFGFVKKDFKHINNVEKFDFYEMGFFKKIKNIHFGSYKNHEIKLFDITCLHGIRIVTRKILSINLKSSFPDFSLTPKDSFFSKNALPDDPGNEERFYAIYIIKSEDEAKVRKLLTYEIRAAIATSPPKTHIQLLQGQITFWREFRQDRNKPLNSKNIIKFVDSSIKKATLIGK